MQGQQLLHVVPARCHKTFPTLKLNPLARWDKKSCEAWIVGKKITYERCHGHTDEQDDDVTDSDSEDDDSDSMDYDSSDEEF